ncbi:MAG: hypothetical protein WCG27_12430 [Pseudomonadota bacterium]
MNVNNKVADQKETSQIQELNTRQKNLIQDREKKLKAMEGYFDRQQDAAKVDRQKNLENLKDQKMADYGQNQLELEKSRVKLQEEKAGLEVERQRLEGEKLQLVESFDATRDENTKINQDNLRRKFDNAKEQMENLTDKSSNLIKKETLKAVSNVERNQSKAQSLLSSKSLESDQVITQKQTEFARAQDKMEKDQFVAIKQSADNFRKETEKQKADYIGQNEVYRQQFEHQLKQEKEQEKVLKQQNQQVFKQEYDKKQLEYQEMLGRVQKKLNEDLKSMVDSHAKIKGSISEKITDPFYQISKVGPKLDVQEDHVVVSIQVPQHEKDGVILSVDGRNLRMTMARRFSERLPDIDGSVYRSQRSETVAKEWKVADILNAKSVKQKYENGVLSFVIKKM